MKYVVILGDGMADEPIESLGGQTPLAYAKTPVMDELASKGEIGLAHTIPKGMSPGSDTANLSVLGYNPRQYYTGRSPLEALSIGVDMEDSDVALRCNLVTLTEEDAPYSQQKILDHSSGEISTEDAGILLKAVADELADETYQFYVGTSYRHCLIWKDGRIIELSQPHDVLGRVIAPYLPADEKLLSMMKKSYEILKDHPINQERKKRGLNPANCCWFWGAGTKPHLDSFQEKNGVKGVMISAVDLLKGIAVGAGMDVACVEGANAGLNTNYEGKWKAAFHALEEGVDFAYIHVEAPDEMGHQGSAQRKVKAVEYLDRRIIEPLTDAMDAVHMNYRLLVMPDHPTPVRVRTHTSDCVPYLLYDSEDLKEEKWNYNEREARESRNLILEGHTIIDKLLKKA